MILRQRPRSRDTIHLCGLHCFGSSRLNGGSRGNSRPIFDDYRTLDSGNGIKGVLRHGPAMSLRCQPLIEGAFVSVNIAARLAENRFGRVRTRFGRVRLRRRSRRLAAFIRCARLFLRSRVRRLCRLTLGLPRKLDRTEPALSGKAGDSNLFDQRALESSFTKIKGVLRYKTAPHIDACVA